jgi:hypothetical protein
VPRPLFAFLTPGQGFPISLRVAVYLLGNLRSGSSRLLNLALRGCPLVVVCLGCGSSLYASFWHIFRTPFSRRGNPAPATALPDLTACLLAIPCVRADEARGLPLPNSSCLHRQLYCSPFLHPLALSAALYAAKQPWAGPYLVGVPVSTSKVPTKRTIVSLPWARLWPWGRLE